MCNCLGLFSAFLCASISVASDQGKSENHSGHSAQGVGSGRTDRIITSLSAQLRGIGVGMFWTAVLYIFASSASCRSMPFTRRGTRTPSHTRKHTYRQRSTRLYGLLYVLVIRPDQGHLRLRARVMLVNVTGNFTDCMCANIDMVAIYPSIYYNNNTTNIRAMCVCIWVCVFMFILSSLCCRAYMFHVHMLLSALASKHICAPHRRLCIISTNWGGRVRGGWRLDGLTAGGWSIWDVRRGRSRAIRSYRALQCDISMRPCGGTQRAIGTGETLNHKLDSVWDVYVFAAQRNAHILSTRYDMP